MKPYIDIVKSTNLRVDDACDQELSPSAIFNSLSPIRSSRQRMADARNQPPINMLLGPIWMKGELMFLVADTGLGKSLLAVTIGNSLSKGIDVLFLYNECGEQVVLYYDFELSDMQFRKRYTNEDNMEYEFSEKFFIDNLNFADLIKAFPGVSFEEILFKKIEHDIETIKPEVLIIDNLTYLSTQTTQKTDIALEVMKVLTDLKRKYNLSILVLAHTPKIDFAAPLSINSMAGSKHLVNFADSVSAIGRSKLGKNVRYIKQLKPSRSSEIMYDTENVIVCEIVKNDSFLTFEHIDFSTEYEHLKQQNGEDKKEVRNELVEQAKAMKVDGKTLAEIAQELLGNEKLKGTISKWLNK